MRLLPTETAHELACGEDESAVDGAMKTIATAPDIGMIARPKNPGREISTIASSIMRFFPFIVVAVYACCIGHVAAKEHPCATYALEQAKKLMRFGVQNP